MAGLNPYCYHRLGFSHLRPILRIKQDFLKGIVIPAFFEGILSTTMVHNGKSRKALCCIQYSSLGSSHNQKAR